MPGALRGGVRVRTVGDGVRVGVAVPLVLSDLRLATIDSRGGAAAAAMSRPGRRQRGQATVELVALLPLLLAVACAAAQVLLAGAAGEFAGHAAEAGAVALLQGADPEAAARDAVPGWSRGRVEVDVSGDAVRVAVRPAPLVPPLADLLTAHAAADAGAGR